MRLGQPVAAGRRIKLTPLIDVIFLLVLFFLLASTFSRYTMIELGGAGGETAASDIEGFVLVRVGPGLEIDVNGRPMPLAELEQEVQALATDGDRHVILSPTGEASVQDLVAALDVLNDTGVPVHLTQSR